VSHISTINLQVVDLDAFEVAVTAKGGRLKRDQKQHRYYAGAMSPCDHAVSVPNSAFEVGMVPRKGPGEFGWDLAYDNWGSDGRVIEQHFGKGLTGLADEYAAQMALRYAAREGIEATRWVDAEGAIHVTLNVQ